MGLVSCKLCTRFFTSSGFLPMLLASASTSLSSCGRNSCNGGSSRRIVTGSPFIALNSPAKSSRWNGKSFASAFSRPAASSARIISRIGPIRSGSKNMCSVRHSPMPSAPNSRAFCASCGVSALVRTFSRRNLSARLMSFLKFLSGSGSCVGTSPSSTSPVLPSMLSVSFGP